MEVYAIVLAVLFLGFVIWIMSRGGYSWKGGWPGERPNVGGIVILVLVVVALVIWSLSRS